MHRLQEPRDKGGGWDGIGDLGSESVEGVRAVYSNGADNPQGVGCSAPLLFSLFILMTWIIMM